MDYKESSWPEFNEQMKLFVESQRDEVVRALSGHGQFRLDPLYAHYGVTAQSWLKMTTEQRRAIVHAFDNAKLNASSERCQSLVISPVTNSAALSISAEDSGISSIPLVTLNAMWKKAAELLSHDNGITPAPGDDSKARMVLSYSQQAPHLVRTCSDGRFVCDSNCPQWCSLSCSS